VRQIERERRIEVAEVLRELLAVVNSHPSLEGVLDFVLERAVELLASDAGLIYLFSPDQDTDFLHIAAARGLDPGRVVPRIRIGSPVSGLAFLRRRPVAFNDLAEVLETEKARDVDPVLEEHGSHVVVRRIGSLLSEPQASSSLERLARTHPAALAVPLVARDETYGSLALFYAQPREFPAEEVDLANAFANQAALVIENTRLHSKSEERATELEMLY
jgi:GAF domain-containing protein